MNLKGLLPQDVVCLKTWIAEIVVTRGYGERERALLECSIGRIAANVIRAEYPKLMSEGWDHPFPRSHAQDHILDWFESSVIGNAPRLANVDDLGRPRKLMKCGSYDDLVREANKAMDRKNAEKAKSLGPDDEQHVADLAEGCKLVRLLTPEALDLESSRMRHCVGHGSYDDDLSDGSSEFYSLRDRKARPVVTIEISCVLVAIGVREIEQIKGKRNGPPDPRHIAVLKPFAKAVGWRGRQTYWPFAVDVDGVEHDIDKIPAGTTFDKLNATIPRGMSVALPSDLTVLHNACIGHGVAAIPERLSVHENLYLASSRERPITLPECLQVGGSIIVWSLDEIAGPIPAHLADKIETAAKVKKMGGLAPLFQDNILDGIDGVDYEIVYGDHDDDEPRLPRP